MKLFVVVLCTIVLSGCSTTTKFEDKNEGQSSAENIILNLIGGIVNAAVVYNDPVGSQDVFKYGGKMPWQSDNDLD